MVSKYFKNLIIIYYVGKNYMIRKKGMYQSTQEQKNKPCSCKQAPLSAIHLDGKVAITCHDSSSQNASKSGILSFPSLPCRSYVQNNLTSLSLSGFICQEEVQEGQSIRHHADMCPRDVELQRSGHSSRRWR